VSDATTLAEAAAPRIPANNLQMLISLSQKNPELLHQLGMSAQMLATEVERQQRSTQLRAVGEADKRAADSGRWAEWLGSYGRRLQREAEAGAEPGERVRAMNGANP
ncbi:Selenoprotein O, partial [Tetrabaena socialis]